MVLAEAEQIKIRDLSQVYFLNRIAQVCLADDALAEKTKEVVVASVQAKKPILESNEFNPNDLKRLEKGIAYYAIFGEQPDAIEAKGLLDIGVQTTLDGKVSAAVEDLIDAGAIVVDVPFVTDPAPKAPIGKVDYLADLNGRLRMADEMDLGQEPLTGELQRVA